MLDYQVWRLLRDDPSCAHSNQPINRRGELRRDFVAGPYEFTRSDAVAICAQFNRDYCAGGYQRFELRRVDGKSLDWRDRELQRFAMREYDEVPWHYEPWYQVKHNEHFCHVSAKHPGLIAYTQNERKGEEDTQTPVRPGRYLNKFFSDVLSNEQIEQWVARLSVQLGENALHVTQDADEIETVYVNGPSSCMSYDASHFEGHCHPTRVYAGPDLALAYIGPVDDATGRCVVWPEQKQYGRIYGDVSRMTLLLEAAGYREGNFKGARLRRVVDENGNGLIVPYFDGFGVADDGTYLVVDGDGSYVPSGQTEGTSEEAGRAYCPNCEEAYDSESSGSWVEDQGEEWCDDCCGNHTTTCDHDGNRYSDRSTGFREVHETVRYWDGRTGVHTSTVADRNLDDFGAAYVDDRDEYWKAEETFYCDDTCQTWHCDNAYLWDGEQISTDAAETRMAAAKVDEAHVMHLYHRNVWLKHRLPASHVCDPDEHLALAA